jgi:alanyl-tRNA synthetase
VDYVAAGIFCFQPYCVTGEMDPPANPLICPQFCLRFNDLDNIGLTGRHFSGFVMIGIQVFNKPNEFIFFKDECVEFNYRWLTEELKIDPSEITFIEDIWAGGGNLGPCVEYFIHGL